MITESCPDAGCATTGGDSGLGLLMQAVRISRPGSGLEAEYAHLKRVRFLRLDAVHTAATRRGLTPWTLV